jgi:long-chain acyl-CoA synthetase
VAETVRLAAARDPAAPALIAGRPGNGSVITWGELDARVDAAAAAMRGLNLPESMGAPARVAIALPQIPEFAVIFFGVLRAGLVAVPVNPGYTPRELRHVLADSGASVLVTTGPVATGVASVRSDLPLLMSVYAVEPADGARPLAELATGSAAVATPRSGEELAVLLYTSGTSGAPKGAMLPHRALLANQHQVAALDPPVIGPGDVVLLALPMFHIFGLNAGLIAVAYHGACGVLLDRFDPGTALDAIVRYRVSVVTAVPQMYAAWLAVPAIPDLDAVRVAVSGGAPLPAEVAREFRETTGLALHQGYGLTETAPVLTTSLASPLVKAGSIGRPIPGVSVRLVAADGSVVAVVAASGLADGLVDDFADDAGGAPGTDPGEIVVGGDNLFLGYWPDRSDGPDDDGWWGTGDVAYADEDGDLYLVDRLGDLILVSGFNVYPIEVEQVLVAHPGVAEAAVVGVPDPVTGESVLAYVVPTDDSISTDELSLHCGRNLARYKCPSAFEIVTELPRTAIGKLRRSTLRTNLEASR